jgi:hypothetical protein
MVCLLLFFLNKFANSNLGYVIFGTLYFDISGIYLELFIVYFASFNFIILIYVNGFLLRFDGLSIILIGSFTLY